MGGDIIDKWWMPYLCLFIILPGCIVVSLWYVLNVHDLYQIITYLILIIGVLYILIFAEIFKTILVIGFVSFVIIFAYMFGVWAPIQSTPQGAFTELVNKQESGDVNGSLNLTVYYFYFEENQNYYDYCRMLMAEYIDTSPFIGLELSSIVTPDRDYYPSEDMNGTIDWVETQFDIEVVDHCYIVPSPLSFGDDLPSWLPYVKIGSKWYLADDFLL